MSINIFEALYLNDVFVNITDATIPVQLFRKEDAGGRNFCNKFDLLNVKRKRNLRVNYIIFYLKSLTFLLLRLIFWLLS